MDNSQELAATAKKNLAWVHRRTWGSESKAKIAEAYHCIVKLQEEIKQLQALVSEFQSQKENFK